MPASAAKFTTRWLPTLAAVLVAAVTARLGFWQIDRAHQKQALETQYERVRDLPVVDLTSIPGDLREQRYRRVRVTGEFEPQHQILLDNQTHEARAGYHVLTPLRIANGTQRVIVNRGWVERSREYPSPPKVLTNFQTITIDGIIDRGDRSLIELSSDTVQGNVWQNFTTERFRAHTGIDVLPIVLLQQSRTEPLVPITIAPDFGIARHYGYAVQWFALTATVIVLYVYYSIKRR